jgi:hypothetical protein
MHLHASMDLSNQKKIDLFKKKRMVETVWFPGIESKCHYNMEGLVFMIWSI